MKKLCLILAMVLLFAACGAPVDLTTEEGQQTLFEKTQEALFTYHRDIYPQGDCDGVGFVIMGHNVEDGKVKVYTINSYGSYKEQNGAMCKTEGHACIPMVVVLEAGSLNYVEVKEPVDDATYFQSVSELFPLADYQNRIFDLSMDDFTTISGMEADHISKYLEENDMEMVIKY